MPKVEDESWFKYAESQGITKDKAKEYWKIAKESGGEDYEKVMGIFKKIIANSKKSKKESVLYRGVRMKLVEADKKDKKEDISQFTTYAKNEGLDNEDQATAIFYQAQGATAKESKKEKDKFGGEEMGMLWGKYKEMIKAAIESSKDKKDDKKKKESIVTSHNYLIEDTMIKPNVTIQIIY